MAAAHISSQEAPVGNHSGGSGVQNMMGGGAARMLVKVQRRAKKVKQKRSLTIDPMNRYKVAWDMFMGAVTLYSVTVSPRSTLTAALDVPNF